MSLFEIISEFCMRLVCAPRFVNVDLFTGLVPHELRTSIRVHVGLRLIMRRLLPQLRHLSQQTRCYVRKRSLGLLKHSGCTRRVYLVLVTGPKCDFIIEQTVSVNRLNRHGQKCRSERDEEDGASAGVHGRESN